MAKIFKKKKNIKIVLSSFTIGLELRYFYPADHIWTTVKITIIIIAYDVAIHTWTWIYLQSQNKNAISGPRSRLYMSLSITHAIHLGYVSKDAAF